jgi:hypothetical protein
MGKKPRTAAKTVAQTSGKSKIAGKSKPIAGKTTKPPKSRPAKSKPAKSKPAKSKPAKSKPAKSKPASATSAAQPLAQSVRALAHSDESRVVSSMELARRATRMRADDDRRDRLHAYRSTLARQPMRDMGLGPKGQLRIFAEGDSWFDYPKILGTGGGVIAHIEKLSRVSILNMAHYGDEARAMLSLPQRRRIESLFKDASLGTFDVMLMSGGGNDIAGDQFCLWLHDHLPGMPASSAIDAQRLQDVLEVVEIAYRELIALRNDLAPGCHIVTHSYDFAQPSDEGVCGVGPWLKPSLDYRGWTDPRDQYEIVKQMLVAFDGMLTTIAQSASKFTVVHLHGLLNPATEWHNEIHPNREGYRKVAIAFNNTLAAIQPKFFTRIT